MQTIEPVQPVKVAGVPNVNYVGQTKTRIPGRESYSAMELLFYLQSKGTRPTTSNEWSGILEWAEKNNLELAKDMVTGDVEVQGDILAWPSEKRIYSKRIQPAPEKGEYPLLIQGYVLEGNPIDYVLRGGTRTELKTLPKSSGRLQNSIDELGLPAGAYVYSDSNPEYGEGLRVVVRGDWYWRPGERRFGASADWGPSGRNSRSASREVFRKVSF